MDAERAWQAYSISKGGTANFPGPIRDAYLAGAEWARKQTLEEAADVAMGPSLSGILHDGATARDIALAIRALGEES